MHAGIHKPTRKHPHFHARAPTHTHTHTQHTHTQHTHTHTHTRYQSKAAGEDPDAEKEMGMAEGLPFAAAVVACRWLRTLCCKVPYLPATHACRHLRQWLCQHGSINGLCQQGSTTLFFFFLPARTAEMGGSSLLP